MRTVCTCTGKRVPPEPVRMEGSRRRHGALPRCALLRGAERQQPRRVVGQRRADARRHLPGLLRKDARVDVGRRRDAEAGEGRRALAPDAVQGKNTTPDPSGDNSPE